jgi:6,7-dimethyl-8-ribityllumazine synthase
MQNASQSFDPAKLEGEGLRVGIVQARFNEGITNALAERCTAELKRLGVRAKDITLVTVPGALEVPVALQAMAEQDNFDALIALGAVIRGETYHFELVCNESAAGVSQIALSYQVPVANAILTVENMAQAEARLDKGADAAKVAVEMANLLGELS